MMLSDIIPAVIHYLATDKLARSRCFRHLANNIEATIALREFGPPKPEAEEQVRHLRGAAQELVTPRCVPPEWLASLANDWATFDLYAWYYEWEPAA